VDATRVSDDMFGRPCRLPIMLWLLEYPKDTIYQSEPPESLGGRTAIRQELERLTRAGLLREERPDGDQRVYYARTDSPLWEIVRAAAAAIDALPKPQRQQRRKTVTTRSERR
jgi:DNA-binding transcriptional ArsR family regulator